MLAVFTVLGIPTAFAHAESEGVVEPSPMTKQLCASTQVPCAIRIGESIREGAATSLYVTGLPGSTARIQMFLLDIVGGDIAGMDPFGDEIVIDINSSGNATTQVPIAPFSFSTIGESQGGWVLVTLADVTWNGHPENIVGHIVPLAARAPTLLGDGYGTEKPVSTSLDMQFANFISGTEFTVEYLGDDGTWHNVTLGADQGGEQDQRTRTIRYSVPNGLVDRPYRFRLHNVTDPSAADSEWVVRPSANAALLERAPLLDIPMLASNVEGTSVLKKPSSRAMLIVSALLLALALAVVMSAPAYAIGRRRIRWSVVT